MGEHLLAGPVLLSVLAGAAINDADTGGVQALDSGAQVRRLRTEIGLGT